MTVPAVMHGSRLLVLEDDYFIAEDIVERLKAQGADVVGPAGTVEDALDLIDETDQLDGALVDLNLHGEMAFPVADALRERRVPLVFVTGYDQATIPPAYADIIRCEKAIDPVKVAKALFG